MGMLPRHKLRRAAIEIDDCWDALRYKLLRTLGGIGPLRILSYRGIGRPDRLILKGRGAVVVRSPSSGFLVISDVDDTVVHTHAVPRARRRGLAHCQRRT